MSDNQNRQFTFATDLKRTKSEEQNTSVLCLLPAETSLPERHALDTILDKEKNVEVIQLSPVRNSKLPLIVTRVFSKISFLTRVIEKIRSHSHLHIFYLKGTSLLKDILPLFVLAKFFGKKIIFEHQNYQDYYIFDDFNRMKKRIFKFADSLIVPSNNIRQSLIKRKFPALFRMPAIYTDIQNSKVVSEVQPRILVDAHLEEIFNFQCLTKAFQLVKQKYPRAELIIKGSGSLKGNFLKLSQSEKMQGVFFDDSVTIDDIDLFLNCYHIEHFSPKIIEAMGHGVPVISTPVGLIENLVSKKNILLFQYNDFSTLADHILSLIEEPELPGRLSKEGAAFYKSFYSDSLKSEKSGKYYRI